MRDLVATAHYVEQQGPAEGVGHRAIDAQVAGLVLARELAKVARLIAVAHEAAVCKGVDSGEFVETTNGVTAQVRGGLKTTGWKQEELRSAVRPILLWDDIEDRDRTGEEVLDLLWDPDTGLHPLSGGAMRGKVARELFDLDLDEFATTERKYTAQIVAGADTILEGLKE